MASALAVIIPARNDAAALERTLAHIETLDGIAEVEVIVAAAGDVAGTTRVVGSRARLVWPDASTRAALMNAGAAEAGGEVLFFLHADSLPPRDAFQLIARALEDGRVAGGAFEHRFTEPHASLRLISLVNRIRYRLTQNYYGDQGIFVRASVFRRLDGYPRLALMEDLVFSQRLKRVGRTVLIREPLLTSGRRFLTRGPWRTFSFIVWLLLLHTLGLDTQRYARRWRGPENRAPGSPWPEDQHGGPRRAPQAPRRSSRPGKAVALLDAPTGPRGPISHPAPADGPVSYPAPPEDPVSHPAQVGGLGGSRPPQLKGLGGSRPPQLQ